MLTNETISKLHEMHLGAMAEAFTAQMNDSQYEVDSPFSRLTFSTVF